MLYRVLGIACVAVALTLLVSGSAVTAGGQAKDAGVKSNTHSGKVVSVDDVKHTLTMTGDTATAKEHTHKVPATAKITCDGKDCKLGDLKTGTRITVTLGTNDEVTRIEATLKDNK
jgi:hypothetical protein